MKRYIVLVLLALVTMSGTCVGDKEDTQQELCEGEKDIKPYSLRIYVPEKVLESDKPIPANIKDICLPICKNLEGAAFNANDAESGSSPMLVRMDNGYSESIATTEKGAMNNKKSIKPIYNRIRNYLSEDYKATKKMSTGFATINQLKTDSLLAVLGKTQIMVIYAENTENSVYKDIKVVSSIDSLRYFIGQSLNEHPNKTVNVFYKVNLTFEETASVKKDDTPPPVLVKSAPVEKQLPKNPLQTVRLQGKWIRIQKGDCVDGRYTVTEQNSISKVTRSFMRDCNLRINGDIDLEKIGKSEEFIIRERDIRDKKKNN